MPNGDKKSKKFERPPPSPIYARLKHFQMVTGKSWQEIADELEIDRSMISRVKTGTRNLSDKALFRLRQAELAAGIHYSARDLIEAGLSAQQTADALLMREPTDEPEFTSNDIDRGFVELEVKYKRGDPPKGYPERVRVTAPPNERALVLAGQVRSLQRNPGLLLSLCLPEGQATKEFLDRLTPSSYRALVESAMALTFGLGWREELE